MAPAVLAITIYCEGRGASTAGGAHPTRRGADAKFTPALRREGRRGEKLPGDLRNASSLPRTRPRATSLSQSAMGSRDWAPRGRAHGASGFPGDDGAGDVRRACARGLARWTRVHFGALCTLRSPFAALETRTVHSTSGEVVSESWQQAKIFLNLRVRCEFASAGGARVSRKLCRPPVPTAQAPGEYTGPYRPAAPSRPIRPQDAAIALWWKLIRVCY